MAYCDDAAPSSTHSNMVIDPAVLICAVPHHRPCHFWAKNSLFRNKHFARVLASCGVIPVDRSGKGNAALFELTFDTLQQGGVIGSFPEGTSYTLPHMLDLKDGTAWAALGYAAALEASPEFQQLANDPLAQNDLRLQIVPTGITYVDKARWRNDCLVMFGAPIDVHKYVPDFVQQTDQKAVVKQLTRDMTQAFRAVTINAPTWPLFHVGNLGRTLLFSDPVRNTLDYAHWVPATQCLIDFFAHYGDVDPSVQKLQSRMLAYHSELNELRLTDRDLVAYAQQRRIAEALPPTASLWTALVPAMGLPLAIKVLGLVLEIPLSLPALLTHLPMYVLGKAGEWWEPNEESKAQTKIIATLLFALPMYSAMLGFMWLYVCDGTLTGLALSFAALVLFASYHLAYVDQRYATWKAIVANVRAIRIVVACHQTGASTPQATPNPLDKLVVLRADIQQTLITLVDDYAALTSSSSLQLPSLDYVQQLLLASPASGTNSPQEI
ncbi:hypothetical protein H4R34_005399 [Dimargaris verticillata]|uniref:Phospholipid/glycerol acyltransferase domain-containing protein n=1 Tax=Dimargaris verticillata TaxID=2761393 RepID=A0A9W8EAA5_9FUNG|nr:hypothetical protein H4R34_005399 [Dimargaris verticillata]